MEFRNGYGEKDICAGSELMKILDKKVGLKISPAGISRLLNEEQIEIKLKVLYALCTALKSTSEKLLIRLEISGESLGSIEVKKLISEKLAINFN